MNKTETCAVSAAEATKTDESYKRIVREISGDIRSGKLSPGTRLQSENRLKELYHTNVYSVRKALAKLKEDGLLYTVPKFGVFVGKQEDKEMTCRADVLPHAVDSVITSSMKVRFATPSGLPCQRRLWEKAAASFSKTSLFAEMEILYHRNTPDSFPEADIYEYAGSFSAYICNKNLLNIREYFSEAIRNSERMFDNTGVPLYYTGPVLLYNLDLLEKLGFKEPVYRNYEEEVAYLEAVTKKAAAASLNIPGTAQNMIFRLGNHLDEIFRDIQEGKLGKEEFVEKYGAVFRRLTDYWRKYKISYPKSALEKFRDFRMGNTPFFFGMLSDFMTLKNVDCPFRSGGALMYSVDDTVTRIPVVLAVDAQSPHPVDSLRLIRHLQNPEFQKDIAEMGMLPLEEKNMAFLPYSNLPRTIEFARPVCFHTPEEHYVCTNVLNVDLWNIVLFNKPVREAIHDTLMFSRSYLSMKLDNMTVDRQKMWSVLYDV